MSWKRVLSKASRRTSKILRSTGKSVCSVKKIVRSSFITILSWGERWKISPQKKKSFWFVSIRCIPHPPPHLGHCISLWINKGFGGWWKMCITLDTSPSLWVCHVVVLCALLLSGWTTAKTYQQEVQKADLHWLTGHILQLPAEIMLWISKAMNEEKICILHSPSAVWLSLSLICNTNVLSSQSRLLWTQSARVNYWQQTLLNHPAKIGKENRHF